MKKELIRKGTTVGFIILQNPPSKEIISELVLDSPSNPIPN